MGRKTGSGPLLHQAFEAGLFLKGLFAAAECLLGVSLFFVANQSIQNAVRILTAQEIVEDPSDLLARFLMGAAQSLSLDAQSFYALYLVSHGGVKLGVVLLLLRGYMWAYPLAVAVLSGFIVYQIHRYLLEPGLALILLSLLDVVVIILTLIEYRSRRRAIT
jgi:uncharacterized membrane protein